MDRDSRSPHTNRRRWLLPPVYLLGAIVMMLALHFLAPGGRLVRASWRYLGVVPIVAGCGIVLACAQTFRRRETTIKPFEVSHVLVTDGLYRYSRNPIYLALVILLCGVAIALGSLAPWIVVPPFAWLLQVRFIKAEETMLAAEFKEQYARYCRQTRRWL